MTEPPSPLYVLVEEFGAYTHIRQVLGPIASEGDQARAAIEQVAWTFRPARPQWERGRSVFECLDGSWLVQVKGATQTFGFRAFLARWQGDRAAS